MHCVPQQEGAWRIKAYALKSNGPAFKSQLQNNLLGDLG